MEKKFKGVLDGAGFYAALSVCILAVGAAGYFLLLQDKAPAAAEPEPLQEVRLPAMESAPLEIPAPEPAEEAPAPEPVPAAAMLSANKSVNRASPGSSASMVSAVTLPTSA